jgi:hypothetical protein
MGTYNLSRMTLSHWDLDMDTKVAVLDGLVNPNTSRSKIVPGCVSDNCTLPSYNDITHSSIGMCRKCVSITPSVAEVHNSSAYIGLNGSTYTIDLLVLPNFNGVGVYELGKTIVSVSGNGYMPHGVTVEAFDISLMDAFNETFKALCKTSIPNVSVVSFTLNGCEWVKNDDNSRMSNSRTELSLSSYWDHLNVVANRVCLIPMHQELSWAYGQQRAYRKHCKRSCSHATSVGARKDSSQLRAIHCPLRR